MEMAEPGFWDNPDRSNKLMKESKNLKDVVELCEEMQNSYDDILTLIEIGNEENDTSLITEVRQELDALVMQLDAIRLSTLLTGE